MSKRGRTGELPAIGDWHNTPNLSQGKNFFIRAETTRITQKINGQRPGFCDRSSSCYSSHFSRLAG